MSRVNPKAILLDIEGTVGDIAFVKTVLFPFARERLERFVTASADEPDVATAIEATRALMDAPEAPLSGVIAQLAAWADADQKIGPLKTVQGLIWREGFESGALKAHLYPDAVEAMQRWHREGRRLAIYSSGSVQAQKDYFAHSIAGRLSALLSGYFDTATGAKGDHHSYSRIATALGFPPGDVLFFSDAPAEVRAALDAGMQAIRVDRGLDPDIRLKDEDGTIVIGSFAAAGV